MCITPLSAMAGFSKHGDDDTFLITSKSLLPTSLSSRKCSHLLVRTQIVSLLTRRTFNDNALQDLKSGAETSHRFDAMHVTPYMSPPGERECFFLYVCVSVWSVVVSVSTLSPYQSLLSLRISHTRALPLRHTSSITPAPQAPCVMWR